MVLNRPAQPLSSVVENITPWLAITVRPYPTCVPLEVDHKTMMWVLTVYWEGEANIGKGVRQGSKGSQLMVHYQASYHLG